jgi:hypothetical protein
MYLDAMDSDEEHDARRRTTSPIDDAQRAGRSSRARLVGAT